MWLFLADSSSSSFECEVGCRLQVVLEVDDLLVQDLRQLLSAWLVGTQQVVLDLAGFQAEVPFADDAWTKSKDESLL